MDEHGEDDRAPEGGGKMTEVTLTVPLSVFYVGIHLIYPNSDLTCQIFQQKLRLIRPGNILQSSITPFW